MLEKIKNYYNAYVQDFPADVPKNAALAFVTSASLHRIANRSNRTALQAGAIAAMTAVIEAATRPIIRSIFPNHPTLGKWIQLLTPHSMLPNRLMGSLFKHDTLASGFIFSCLDAVTMLDLLQRYLRRPLFIPPKKRMEVFTRLIGYLGLTGLKFATFNHDWYQRNIGRVTWA